jgi:hypothetical protein
MHHRISAQDNPPASSHCQPGPGTRREAPHAQHESMTRHNPHSAHSPALRCHPKPASEHVYPRPTQNIPSHYLNRDSNNRPMGILLERWCCAVRTYT